MAVLKPIPAPRPFEADERQREAIEHVHGPMLVVAGAGTGKTTVLTRRIARLVQQGHARSDEVLALTYTENAAREMQERVQAEIGGDVSLLQVATFHAYCNNLLIRNGRQFGVLDDADLWIYLRRRIRDLHLNYFVRAANVGKFLQDLLDFMRRCQDELVGPERYAEYVRQLERGELPVPRVCKSKHAGELSAEEVLERCREISGAFTAVEGMLKEDNLGTFGHMITRAYDLLRQDPALLAREREHARHILVDEFQDANFAQVKILQYLAGEECNVFAVGDPDQAIYRFRGASSGAFDLFQHNFPGAKLVVLEKNQRSTTAILKCAHVHIAKNPDVFSKQNSILRYRRSPLLSARDEAAVREGRESNSASVEVVLLNAKEAESFDLVTTIRQRQKQLRCKWGKFAVLYRQHLHRNELAVELAEQGVPFSIENMDVMDTPQARDLVACLRAVASGNDSASLFRVAALPQFTIDPEELRNGMKALPREGQNAGMAAVLGKIQGGAAVLEALQQARDEVARKKIGGGAALEIVMRRFALDRTSPPNVAILDFVRRWEEKPKPIIKTGELAELIEYLDYFREAGGVISLPPSRDDNAVRLMTPHAAKGLEFDQVFIIRAISPSFPASFKESLVEFPRELRDPDSVATQEDKVLHEQEERRLFYVAMTRARDALTIYARRGKGQKDPTPPGFLRDLLKDASLGRWMEQRAARAFQVEIFGQEPTAGAVSRTTQWLSIPPSPGLGTRLSASAVQRYEICPLQFKLERDWRIPGDVPAAMQFGASMHRVLRAYFDSIRFERPMPDEEVVELLRTDLAQAGIQERYQHDLYMEQGTQQLKEFLSACRRGPLPEVLHTEEFFEIKIGQTTVVGRIDRIDRQPDGQVVITDYKTGRPQVQEDADESLQLTIYALAAREKWDYRSERLVFQNLQENTSVVTLRTVSQLEEAKLKVQDVAQKVAEGRFEPKPGFHCVFCAYRSLCPATENRVYSKTT